jgi:secondary thiamine-phosphate synthase enzyme
MYRTEIVIKTAGRGFYPLSRAIEQAVGRAAVSTGLCHVFLLHTSASLLVTENADPDVRLDLEAFMQRLVPDGRSHYRHNLEGPDDMPAHIRSVLTQTEVTVPVQDGQLALGTWQELYLWEHRLQAHQRRLLLTVF